MVGRISRIAKRIFLAFTCRRHVTRSGFGYDGADKGLSAFDYRYQLLLWAYPKDGKVKIVYAKKAYNAFYHLCNNSTDSDIGQIGKDIKDAFRTHPRSASERNFKVLLWNGIMDSEFSKFKGATFLVDRVDTLDYDKAKELLTTKYDFSLLNFYAVFGEGTQAESGEASADDSRRFSCDGMDFEVNDSTMDKEHVCRMMAVVKSKLPASLVSKLLYGKVELKGKFNSSGANTIADYTRSDDMIRLDSGDGFVTSMIHELGHRWHYKFCKPNQERALMKLYRKCKQYYDPSLTYQYGDTLGMANGNTVVIVGETDSDYRFYVVDNSENSPTKSMPKKYFTGRMVVSVNGKPIDRYTLPRQYAGKNFREFIACCFEHIYGGWPIAGNVKSEFVKIVEEEQQ